MGGSIYGQVICFPFISLPQTSTAISGLTRFLLSRQRIWQAYATEGRPSIPPSALRPFLQAFYTPSSPYQQPPSLSLIFSLCMHVTVQNATARPPHPAYASPSLPPPHATWRRAPPSPPNLRPQIFTRSSALNTTPIPPPPPGEAACCHAQPCWRGTRQVPRRHE